VTTAGVVGSDGVEDPGVLLGGSDDVVVEVGSDEVDTVVETPDNVVRGEARGVDVYVGVAQPARPTTAAAAVARTAGGNRLFLKPSTPQGVLPSWR
jgi:hypothetical protein